MTINTQPITLLVCALGGEGGGVLAEWLVEAAAHAGYLAQSTSIPGVAQRTGATTYYIEVFPEPEAQLGGRTPVFGLSPVAGALDALVSSELLETARQTALGMVSKDRTRVIASHDRTLTTLEKMQPTDGRVSSGDLQNLIRGQSRSALFFDMQAVAQRAGTVASAVMLGAIAGARLFPLPREAFEAAIKASGKGVEASLRGFAAAFELGASDEESPQGAIPAAATAERAKQREAWTATVEEFASLGEQRLAGYQDRAYADLYRKRLERILRAERAADPKGVHERAAARETARFLALWMAFDDIVHVAHLKSRAARWERVRKDVKASPEEIVHVYDHFKPGVPEFAALLPQGLANALIAWDKRRQARGKTPLAFPLKVGAHGVSGLAMLRALAWLRWLRPHGTRYREEQAMIETWLERIERGFQEDWALGHEIALCGRMIKGYGATLERGKQNLTHVLDHLATGSEPPVKRAAAIALARAAALADDAGKALDKQMIELGAPPRPAKAQPIVWAKRRAAAHWR